MRTRQQIIYAGCIVLTFISAYLISLGFYDYIMPAEGHMVNFVTILYGDDAVTSREHIENMDIIISLNGFFLLMLASYYANPHNNGSIKPVEAKTATNLHESHDEA